MRGLACGSLDRAAEISLIGFLAERSIYIAAVLGDDSAVRRFLAVEPVDCHLQREPSNWDALTDLMLLEIPAARPGAVGNGFVHAAEALLDAGASPNTGFFADDHRPSRSSKALSTAPPVWPTTLHSPGCSWTGAPIRMMAKFPITPRRLT